MLVPGSNYLPWPQRCGFGDLNILLFNVALLGIYMLKSLKLVEGVGMDGLGRL
jgi:hypothetical protein